MYKISLEKITPIVTRDGLIRNYNYRVYIFSNDIDIKIFYILTCWKLIYGFDIYKYKE